MDVVRRRTQSMVDRRIRVSIVVSVLAEIDKAKVATTARCCLPRTDVHGGERIETLATQQTTRESNRQKQRKRRDEREEAKCAIPSAYHLAK